MADCQGGTKREEAIMTNQADVLTVCSCAAYEGTEANMPILIDRVLHRYKMDCIPVEQHKKMGKPHPEVTRLQAELILSERREATLHQRLADCRRDLDNQRRANDCLLALAQEDSIIIKELQDRL
jgi:hypothetical protein